MFIDSRLIFFNFAICTSMICGYYTLLSINAYKLTRDLNRNFNVDVPSFGDCWTTPLIAAGVLFLYKKMTEIILVKRLQPICKDENDSDLQLLRAKKASMNAAKTVYYSVVTYWGYQLLKDTSFMPPILGGSGDVHNCFVNVPF